MSPVKPSNQVAAGTWAREKTNSSYLLEANSNNTCDRCGVIECKKLKKLKDKRAEEKKGVITPPSSEE